LDAREKRAQPGSYKEQKTALVSFPPIATVLSQKKSIRIDHLPTSLSSRVYLVKNNYAIIRTHKKYRKWVHETIETGRRQMILVAGPSLSTDQISWSAAGALDSAIFTSTIAYVHFVPRLPLIRKTLTAGPPMILVFTVIPAF
jgi:hypothetical protein